MPKNLYERLPGDGRFPSDIRYRPASQAVNLGEVAVEAAVDEVRVTNAIQLKLWLIFCSSHSVYRKGKSSGTGLFIDSEVISSTR